MLRPRFSKKIHQPWITAAVPRFVKLMVYYLAMSGHGSFYGAMNRYVEYLIWMYMYIYIYMYMLYWYLYSYSHSFYIYPYLICWYINNIIYLYLYLYILFSICIYVYEQRTKPSTSAKGRGWNGHRFLCVPHRSWGCNVCNKIRRTCVSRVIVFCVTPIVPESFMMVSSINVLV